MRYKCIVLYFSFNSLSTVLFFTSFPNISDFVNHPFHPFPLKFTKGSSMTPKRKLTRSSTKSEKGESLKSPRQEPTTPSIPSPLIIVEVTESWFENHMAFGKWIDVFKHRSISFVDILDYNFFLWEDFKIISAFIESTTSKLLDPSSMSYPTLVKIFYCNLSFITLDGFPALLRSYVKDQELVITQTIINEFFKFSNVVDDSTPNSIAFQIAKDMFVSSSHLDFSPTRQLTHNGSTLSKKLLHQNLPLRNLIQRECQRKTTTRTLNKA